MVNPFSAGTPTLQEAPSFAWRTNGAAPQPPRWSMPNMRSAAGMLGMSSGASSARTAPCPCSAAPRSGVQCVLSSLRDSGPPHYPSEPSRSCHGLTCVVIKSPFVVHGSEARRSTISDVLDARMMRSASRVPSSGPTRTAKRCSKSASMNAAWPAHSAWPSRGLESSHAGPLDRKTANRRSISPTLSPHIVMRGPLSQLLDAPGSAKRFCRSAAALFSGRLQRRLGGRFVYVEHRTPHREPPGTMFREYPQITTRCVELLRRALVEILRRRLHALVRRRHTDHVNVRCRKPAPKISVIGRDTRSTTSQPVHQRLADPGHHRRPARRTASCR